MGARHERGRDAWGADAAFARAGPLRARRLQGRLIRARALGAAAVRRFSRRGPPRTGAAIRRRNSRAGLSLAHEGGGGATRRPSEIAEACGAARGPTPAGQRPATGEGSRGGARRRTAISSANGGFVRRGLRGRPRLPGPKAGRALRDESRVSLPGLRRAPMDEMSGRELTQIRPQTKCAAILEGDGAGTARNSSGPAVQRDLHHPPRRGRAGSSPPTEARARFEGQDRQRRDPPPRLELGTSSGRAQVTAGGA